MTISIDGSQAVAGIPLVHHVSTPLTLVPPQVPGWRGADATESPIVIRHQVGSVDVDGLAPLFEIEPWMTYYEDGAGSTAIRYHSADAAHPVQLMRTVRPGEEYLVSYAFAPAAPLERRGKEMSAYAIALAERRRGLMAHGCAFILPSGRAALCLGVSGAGKSTLAKMMLARDDVRVMNDDRQALTREPDGLHVWSTPWPGSAGIANDGHAPLGVLVLIGRGPVCEMRRPGSRQVVQRLLTTLALPNWNDAALADGLELVNEVVSRVPVVELAYPLLPATPGWIVETLTEIERR